MKIKEQELAAAVIDWLEKNRWDVYQEVVCKGDRADIVAKNGPLLWVIECKTSLSFEVIGQAYNWQDRAHLVSIAVPEPKISKKSYRLVTRILRDYRIGRIYIRRRKTHDAGYFFEAHEDISPTLIRKPYMRNVSGWKLEDFLCDEQKTWAKAGTCGGGYWTPFNQTKRNVEKYVQDNPGCFYKQMIDHLEHHYHSRGSANSALRHWIDRGVIDVRTEKDGRYLRLYPNEQ